MFEFTSLCLASLDNLKCRKLEFFIFLNLRRLTSTGDAYFNISFDYAIRSLLLIKLN